MDEVHELNRAEKMAGDIADILARLSALEKKIDVLASMVVSRAGRIKADPKHVGQKKKVRKQTRNNKSKS
jgi:tetrahydromethanopterin S-methyltransferase subunit G